MLRKFAWPVLLLLLTATQLLATECAAQCDAMSAIASHGKMSCPAHCHGMAAQASDTHSVLHGAESCGNRICRSDLALLPKQMLHAPDATRLSVHAIAQEYRSAAFLFTPVQVSSPAHQRRAQAVPAFDPLISSLRI
jgi:hypothetical protein